MLYNLDFCKFLLKKNILLYYIEKEPNEIRHFSYFTVKVKKIKDLFGLYGFFSS